MSKLMAMIAAAVLIAGAFGPARADSTSPTVNPDAYDPQSIGFGDPAAASVIITFSEFPVDTTITNQYVPQGIDFSAQPVFIAADVSNPTSPVLSGTPQFTGPITGCFVHPTTGKAGTRRQFQLDAGYFDQLNTTQIAWFDSRGRQLGSVTNSALGIEHFTITVPSGSLGIRCWTMSAVGAEPAGFAVDNVSFRGFLK